MTNLAIQQACHYLKQGLIIAYPTEAVYGLGCDPFQEQAVHRLLKIKQRDISKGLILIASSWQQIKPLIGDLDEKCLARVQNSWPGPVTWLFPASTKVPKWITGQHHTIALRLTNHPVAVALCHNFGGPIVSTSANLAGEPALKSAEAVRDTFNDQIDYIVPGPIGSLQNPTPIRDALSGQLYRE